MKARDKFLHDVATLKKRGMTHDQAWAMQKQIDPATYLAMERGEDAAVSLANSADATSPDDALVPDWAFRLVGLPAGSTLATFRAKLQNGATIPDQQAKALMIHIATVFERRENLVRTASWPRLKALLPELFAFDAPIWGAYTMPDIRGNFMMANAEGVATKGAGRRSVALHNIRNRDED